MPLANREVLVEFKDVSKTYDGHDLAVKNLDLKIHEGEFLTLLGPSGSGKTTTLMMLAGFESPSSGSIWLSGNRIDRLPPHRRGIGVVFQQYALFPHMTVAENVAYPLVCRKMPKDEIQRQVKKALQMVELEEFASRHPNQLSGGQQQRVALTRALVFEPSIVLMDEPLGALDRKLRETLQMEIRRIHRELEVTIVYVTHDQNEALTMSDRIAVYRNGEIAQIGTPDEIYHNPNDSYVATFVGESNLLSGVVETNDNSTSVVARLDLGSKVEATIEKSSRITAGQHIAASIRPEDIHLSQSTGIDASSTVNELSGIVSDLMFLGEQYRVTMLLPNGQQFILKLSIREGGGLSLNQQVTVCWDREDLNILEVVSP